MPESVTVVAAYYCLDKSKHTVAQYQDWIANFMSFDFKCLIYVDQKSHSILVQRYPETESRRYRILEIADFRTAKLDWGTDEQMDHERSIGQNRFLYMVWNEKPFLLKRALDENPYHSTHFLWVDIGSFRDKRLLEYLRPFPQPTRMPEGKITITQVQPFRQQENMQCWKYDNRFQFVNRLSASVFGGDEQSIMALMRLYDSVLMGIRNAGVFAGKDQTILNFCAIQRPELFHCVTPTASDYSDWMYLHAYLANARLPNSKWYKIGLGSVAAVIVIFIIALVYNRRQRRTRGLKTQEKSLTHPPR